MSKVDEKKYLIEFYHTEIDIISKKANIIYWITMIILVGYFVIVEHIYNSLRG